MGYDKKISKAVIGRLPRYYRYLGSLIDNDITRISSKELSEQMSITASQIRQDLNNFGGFGQQGYGYNVIYLYNEIKKILGLGKEYNIVIIGAGNIGQALANYTYFEKRGFVVKGIFDTNPKVIGLSVRGVAIQDIDSLEEYIAANETHIAVLCVPTSAAKDIAKRLEKTSIKGIWNFSNTDLNLPEDILVENVYLTDSLMTLSYKINEPEIRKYLKD